MNDNSRKADRKVSRQDLMGYFQDGKLPTEAHFAELIESMLHMDDEGFKKTPLEGLRIASAVGQHALISFFRQESSSLAQWALRYGGPGDNLVVHAGAGPQPAATSAAADKPAPPVLALDRRGRVGVNVDSAAYTLQVGGTVASKARCGMPPKKAEKPMKADHRWHVLADKLHDSVALEVVVKVSQDKPPRYAMLHAVAVNAGNPRLSWFDRWVLRKNRIRCNEAWYGQRCDRLELAWEADGADHYKLLVRTKCSYGDDPPLIKAHVTDLFPAEAEDDPLAASN